MLKRVLSGKEVFIDQMVIILFRLSSSIYNEILRGRYGLGNYNIRPGYENLYCLEQDKPTLSNVGSLSVEEIVCRVQNGENLCNQVKYLLNENYSDYNTLLNLRYLSPASTNQNEMLLRKKRDPQNPALSTRWL